MSSLTVTFILLYTHSIIQTCLYSLSFLLIILNAFILCGCSKKIPNLTKIKIPLYCVFQRTLYKRNTKYVNGGFLCSRGHRSAGRDSVNAVGTGSSHRNTGCLDGWPSPMTPLLLPFSCQPVAPTVDTLSSVIFSPRHKYKYNRYGFVRK